jgi:tetratricopeptide (TPR) repeat protein
MAQNVLPPENDAPENAMLNQAVKLIGEGNYPKAKEMLTGLLQTDQHNATYWVWLSAAMETQKERLYCLQMAYKIDPSNAAARRGLILLGALEADGTQTPFPMNHVRPWESRLRLADEKPRPTGIRRITTNPFFRLGVVGLISVLLVGGAIFGIGAFISNRRVAPVNLTPPTPRPTVTPVPRKGPTLNATIVPLSDLLPNGHTYTPTALYALTPHTDIAADPYRAALNSYNKQQWDTVINMMEQIATIQPGSVDAIYFMGEGKRLAGQYEDALEYYKEAAKVNAKYAPIYLGRARANLGISSQRAVLVDLNKAIELDKNYSEAYLERGLYFFRRGDNISARKDLEQASILYPDSPVIQVNLARLLLALGENEAALEAAQKANSLDVTMLEAYLMVGIAARASGQIDLAVDVLDKYTQYSDTNPEAFTILGAAYYGRGDYELALKNVNQAISLNNQSSESYRWRGEIYLATKEYQKAFDDFKKSYTINITFDAGIGIARAILGKTNPRDDTKKVREAYQEALFYINDVEKQLKTDKQRGIYYYYRATTLELLNDQIIASRTWELLLKLPEDAVTEEMREEAQARVVALQSATPPPPTERPSATPRVTLTRRVTLTPTQTPTPKK